jgi:hypothetical protein
MTVNSLALPTLPDKRTTFSSVGVTVNDQQKQKQLEVAGKLPPNSIDVITIMAHSTPVYTSLLL